MIIGNGLCATAMLIVGSIYASAAGNIHDYCNDILLDIFQFLNGHHVQDICGGDTAYHDSGCSEQSCADC